MSTINIDLPSNWKVIEVSEMPERRWSVGRTPLLNNLVETLVKSPGHKYLVYTNTDRGKLTGRVTSLKRAINRMGYKLEHFDIRTTDNYGDMDEAGLFVSYVGEGAR